MELNLRFPNVNQVVVKFDDQETDALDFVSPLTEADLKEIQWYLETYSAYYTSDPDDARAQRLEANLEKWGADLFNTVFASRAAQRIFNDFQDENDEAKLLTIAASHPFILSLPWELLRDPEGTYLVHDNPRISVRRKLAGAGGGRRPFKVTAKEKARILFVTSRPSDAGFIDPRAEAIPVLKAIETEAADRVEVEFLRPATMDALIDRLEDSRLPAVDILHFDGHGVYDSQGHLHQKAKLADPALKASNVDVKPNMGYLLFENEAGESALITAETLGDMLNRQKVGLIVLSACQSAKVAGEDPMGSVAARLTHAGIPTVLAMTHSVLVTTATQLFTKFYQRLVRGEGTGEALDNARRDLYLNRERGERQRGETRITLKLQDWFLPALYQAGKDTPLLTSDGNGVARNAPTEDGDTNLPEVQEAGFWGRSRELWQIERAFVQGTERITISGFGGQGKTYLATEAGRWLNRTGMFEKVCFVDFAGFQGMDALSYSVSVLATVLEQSFIDGDAVRKYLWQSRVSLLVILDNLEVLAGEALRDLLAAAKVWSETGSSVKVIVTTRDGNLQAAGYESVGTRKHIAMPLRGLSADDAVNYFNALVKLSPEPRIELPERDALIELFGRVDFHPLWVASLAQQLKTRRIGELGLRLERILDELPDNENKSLRASLQLSLDRLDGQARELLPRLGVFQCGAIESQLLDITEIEEVAWQGLRDSLVATGLITLEHLPNISVPYLKFHPTLAPALWEGSPQTASEREKLIERHREQYYQLSRYLYFEDNKNPHEVRAMAMRELPNLLYGVRGALAAETDYAVDFVECVSRFLMVFGMNKDRQQLTEQTKHLGAVGSEQWFLAQSNLGEQLRGQEQLQAAAEIFSGILGQLGEEPSYRRCLTLCRLGRCFRSAGQAAQAAELYRQGIAVGERLEQSDGVKRQIGLLNTDLGDVLTDSGDFGAARSVYEKALEICTEQQDGRQMGVVNAQLGTLAMREGDRQDALERYQAALKIFRQLNEPVSEAVAWHQLGWVFEESRQWDAAEQHYRRSAAIREQQGLIAGNNGAAASWNQLARVCEGAVKLAAAEEWYRKAIQSNRKIGDQSLLAGNLNNLANLLQGDLARLPEARQLAEEALVIKQTLDPAAAEIWHTYSILAEITEKQGDLAQSKEYRRLARESRAAYAGTQYELQKFAQVIVGVVRATVEAEARQQMEQELERMAQGSDDWQRLSRVIPRIWAGERDEETLCENLNPLSNNSAMVVAILEGINNPDSLQRFLE